MRRSLTTPDRRQTPPPLAVVRQRKTPAAPRYTVSASGSPVRNENLLLQLKFCSLQSPMHYLSCEKSGLGERDQQRRREAERLREPAREMTDRMQLSTAAAGALRYARAAADAWRGECVRVAGASLCVPGSRRIRLSVVAGNLRVHRLIDALARPGSTVVDVGANIGYNAVHA